MFFEVKNLQTNNSKQLLKSKRQITLSGLERHLNYVNIVAPAVCRPDYCWNTFPVMRAFEGKKGIVELT